MLMNFFKNKTAQSVMEYSLIFILVSIPLGWSFLNIRTAITTKSIRTMYSVAGVPDKNSQATTDDFFTSKYLR